MENLKNITEFVVVSNLENRVLNTGINRAQNWWKNRHNGSEPETINQTPQAQAASSPPPPPPPPVGVMSGQLLITVLRAQDLYESRLSKISGSSLEHPYVVIECNQQRFQTAQADVNSNHRHPQWSSNNGPYSFNVFNPQADRVTIWVQQQDSLRVMKRGEPKTLGMCETNVSQLLAQPQTWIALRKDNKPVGEVLLQSVFYQKNDAPPPYDQF